VAVEQLPILRTKVSGLGENRSGALK
jgi:hypothetical protein